MQKGKLKLKETMMMRGGSSKTIIFGITKVNASVTPSYTVMEQQTNQFCGKLRRRTRKKKQPVIAIKS